MTRLHTSGASRRVAESSHPKPLWHGITLVAGGAVGAGMFALPMVSSGAWFAWAAFGLMLVCGFTYWAATLLLEVNVRYPEGSSFDTLIRSTLGNKWAAINNLSIAFIMFVLMYAYTTSGAGILERSLELLIPANALKYFPRALLSVIFACMVALVIGLGTSFVSRITSALMLAMVLSFSVANSGMIISLNMSNLYSQPNADITFLWSALPVFVTAFACAGLVPSLSTHYQNQPLKIARSVLFGLLLVLIVYLIWLASTLGHIPRTEFVSVSDNGGGLSALVSSLQKRTDSEVIQFSLAWFSNFAVLTSFLSVGLGLVHFIVDRFALSETRLSRFAALVMAFLPPLIASAVAPYGFVSAIAYAGVFVAFSFFIVPALMYRRVQIDDHQKFSPCSQISWLAVALFGLAVVVLKLANLVSLLPVYP